jgi:hypothetical protein
MIKGLTGIKGSSRIKRLTKVRGFSAIEVLTCAALAGLVSGVAFVASEPMREKTRENTCMGNLHQIYVGLQLYSNDNPGPEQYPGMGQIKMVPHVTTILPYVKSQSIFFCPNTPPMKDSRLKYWSTYELNFITVRSDGSPKTQAFLNTFKSDLANLGPKMPLVICNMHDETYYGPREQDIDPDLAQPFQLHLQLDGSVAAHRFVAKRHRSFTMN